MMTDDQLKQLRAQVFPWLKQGIKRQFSEGEDKEAYRKDIRAAKAIGPMAWWDQAYYNYTLYCAEMVDRGNGMFFTGVRFNGELCDSMTVMEEFALDGKAILFTSDQGNILAIHGLPDGTISTGKNEKGEPVISPLEDLKKVVPRGTYYLVSCYNACKDNEVLNQLAKEGWHFIKAGSSGSVNLGPISPNHVMVSYAITKEDFKELAGDKWDDTLYYEIPDPVMGIAL